MIMSYYDGISMKLRGQVKLYRSIYVRQNGVYGYDRFCPHWHSWIDGYDLKDYDELHDIKGTYSYGKT